MAVEWMAAERGRDMRTRDGKEVLSPFSLLRFPLRFARQIDTATGDCLPVQRFTEAQRAPDPELRYAVVCALRRRSDAGAVTVYNPHTDTVTLPPMR